MPVAKFFLPKPPGLTIGEEINRGSWGTVYEGDLDGQPVAVKKIHNALLKGAEGVGSTESLLEGFHRECMLLEKADHRNVVKFYGAYYDQVTGEPILVMEKMKENLRDYLKRKRDKISRQKAIEICLSIAGALRYLHSLPQPIVHRDLNDKNIMISEDGTIKIGDLGQSRLKEHNAEYFYTLGPGAITFMPPEALKDGPRYNEKIDTFSAGVLMLEVATQHYPVVTPVNIQAVKEVVRRAEDLLKLPEDHPLKPIVIQCLEDDPKKRLSTTLLYEYLNREHLNQLSKETKNIEYGFVIIEDIIQVAFKSEGSQEVHSISKFRQGSTIAALYEERNKEIQSGPLSFFKFGKEALQHYETEKSVNDRLVLFKDYHTMLEDINYEVSSHSDPVRKLSIVDLLADTLKYIRSASYFQSSKWFVLVNGNPHPGIIDAIAEKAQFEKLALLPLHQCAIAGKVLTLQTCDDFHGYQEMFITIFRHNTVLNIVLFEVSSSHPVVLANKKSSLFVTMKKSNVVDLTTVHQTLSKERLTHDLSEIIKDWSDADYGLRKKNILVCSSVEEFLFVDQMESQLQDFGTVLISNHDEVVCGGAMYAKFGLR